MGTTSGPADSPAWRRHAGVVTARGRRLSLALLVVIGILISACGGAAPALPSALAPSSATQTALPVATDALSTGAVPIALPVIDLATDLNLSMVRQETDDRTRGRVQAGFPTEAGAGWGALSESADDAIDAATLAIAAEFDIAVPTARQDVRFASVVLPDRFDGAQPASAASALAIVTAALTAGQALGQGGTRQASKSETRTTTEGDDVATVTVNMKGTITSTGSRVVAEFTFDLSGSVANNISGATAQMTGSATAHVEIDGCPDASGSSKGKVSLSSSETVSGQHDGGEGTASWTRDLSGDFDIAVDDEANISGLTVDVKANETVVESDREPGDDEPQTEGHELGVSVHAEYESGPGFAGTVADDSKTDGDVTHQKDATKAHLASLVKSALYAIMVAAVGLGQNAEAFWRDGKCIEVIVDPEGGDVEADSTTDVTAAVRHRFEGNELDKPVEATLAGVTAIEPAGRKQPAPATSIYTAGPNEGDKGDVTFESVSNRGIGKKTVTFTVRPTGWTTTAASLSGEITGTKCNGLGGDWTIEAVDFSPSAQTTIIVSIDEATLAGTFNFHEVLTDAGLPFVQTFDARGTARVVLNEDGSVTMTLDKAPITLRSELNGKIAVPTVTIEGVERVYPWLPDAGEACSSSGSPRTGSPGAESLDDRIPTT